MMMFVAVGDTSRQKLQNWWKGVCVIIVCII